MEEIFSLEKYKEILANYCPKVEDKKNTEDRLNYINTLYSNQYLLRIVKDTATFTSYLLKSFRSISSYFFPNVEYQTMIYGYDYINNGCKLGGPCDCIIKIRRDDKDELVSKSLLQKILPTSFRISFEQGTICATDEFSKKHSLSIDELNILGPRSDYESVYNKYIKKQKNKR